MILLDRIGDAELPPDYALVETEVDFLRLAPEGQPLFVRGERLCDWASHFYRGRKMVVREVQSPIRELQVAVPTLSDTQAYTLYERIGPTRWGKLERPLQALHLLESLYPLRMWLDPPSLSHAAEWLLWLHHVRPDPIIRSVFAPIVEIWRDAASDTERHLYYATDGEMAGEFLRAWLHITPRPTFATIDMFPLAVPPDLMNEARQIWAQQIIESRGGAFDKIERLLLPGPLRRVAAEETAAYLLHHPEDLTRERCQRLARFLVSKRQEELTALLPPEQPAALPTLVQDVLNWFEAQYLPFRLWQSRHGDAEADAAAESAALHFAKWYLAEYPKGLMGDALHEHLSFNQAISSASDDGTTIVIVLDGLHAEDARQLVVALERDVRRLSLLERRWVFAVVPTVTRFAKDALLKGREPSEAKNKPLLAPVLPERIDPTHQLAKAQPGDVLVWRVMEPDDTYHKRNAYETLSRAVESALNRVSLTISDIVDNVPDERLLRIIITTDHGRLLRRAVRTAPVPPGMQSHGRAAWGSKRHDFEESGVLYEGDIAFLHGERFGLPDDASEAAVLIGSAMFRTNDGKAGSEAYPHGGVTPEEVIVPWLVFQRDWKEPELVITLGGNGIGGQKGRARIRVMNLGDAELTILHVTLRLSDNESSEHDLGMIVKPRSTEEGIVELDPWPTEAEYRAATALATIELPAGQRFSTSVKLELVTEEMYRRDNILEDLL